MKQKLKALVAAALCCSMLCGCAGEHSEVPSGVGSVSSDSTVSAVTAGENTSDITSGPTESTASGTDPGSQTSTSGTSAPVGRDGTPVSESGRDGTPDSESGRDSEPVEAEPANDVSPSDFAASWKVTNQWEEGGRTCVGYEVSVTNSSGRDIQSWTVSAGGLPQDFEISASWNGIFSVKDNTLAVSNESYNGEIKNGGSAGFGFNCKFTGEFSPSNVLVNGSAADSSSGSAAADNGGNDSRSQTTAVTTEQTVPPAPDDPEGTTPAAAHGQLSVKGSQLIDMNGNAYQLRGMSTHGITWFPDFVNENAFRTLRDDWNTNVVRMAMYVDEWGSGQCYMKNKDGSRKLLEQGVDLCIKLGMYVIIDWHVLNPGDPDPYTDAAIEFFDSVSKKYADYPNIIYEIVNEPNGNVSWSGKIKPYAEKVIPVIRKNDSDAVIIVGTPTWSQDIDQALADPLDEENVMYALHFYAATHTDWLRERAEKCIKSGLPLFVSEFGCCDASGNGANDFAQTEKWLGLLDKYGISYCNWNLANKDESSSCFRSSAKADGNWGENDYSQSGAWIRNWFRNH